MLDKLNGTTLDKKSKRLYPKSDPQNKFGHNDRELFNDSSTYKPIPVIHIQDISLKPFQKRSHRYSQIRPLQ